MNDRVKRITERTTTVRNSAESLIRTIQDQRVREFFLTPIFNALSDIESVLLPYAEKAANADAASGWYSAAEMMASIAEKQLKAAQDTVAKYGVNLRLVGG